MIVVDSTIIAAWAVPAPWTTAAVRLLQSPSDLIAPQAALTQAWKALQHLHVQGHVNREAFQYLSRLLPAALSAIAADQQLMPEAADLMAEHGLRPEPALCLALARVRKARLATADEAFVPKAAIVLAPDRILHVRTLHNRMADDGKGSAREKPPKKAAG